jgi:hypothetical protein
MSQFPRLPTVAWTAVEMGVEMVEGEVGLMVAKHSQYNARRNNKQ